MIKVDLHFFGTITFLGVGGQNCNSNPFKLIWVTPIKRERNSEYGFWVLYLAANHFISIW